MKRALSIHRLTGVVAALGVVAGLVGFLGATEGRLPFEHLVAKYSGWPAGLALVVGLSVGAHLASGVVLRAARSSPTDGDKLGLRPLQRLSGWVAVAFLLLHFGHAWQWGHASPLDAYAALRSDLGRVPYLVAYCAGGAALALHVGQGLELALDALPTSTSTAPAGVRFALWAFVSVVCFAFVFVLSYFATGTARFWVF